MNLLIMLHKYNQNKKNPWIITIAPNTMMPAITCSYYGSEHIAEQKEGGNVNKIFSI